jgi:hypothetical protein
MPWKKTRNSRAKRVTRDSTRVDSNSVEPSRVLVFVAKCVQAKQAEFIELGVARLAR